MDYKASFSTIKLSQTLSNLGTWIHSTAMSSIFGCRVKKLFHQLFVFIVLLTFYVFCLIICKFFKNLPIFCLSSNQETLEFTMTLGMNVNISSASHFNKLMCQKSWNKEIISCIVRENKILVVEISRNLRIFRRSEKILHD